jgi:hypothetical protein
VDDVRDGQEVWVVIQAVVLGDFLVGSASVWGSGVFAGKQGESCEEDEKKVFHDFGFEDLVDFEGF